MALIRGVNVGGVTLPMALAREVCAAAGGRTVRSYLASGNLVYEAEAGFDAVRLEAALGAAIGRAVRVMVLDAAAYGARVASNPFAGGEGSRVHGFFALGEIAPDLDAIEALRDPSEAVCVAQGVVWFAAPAGMGRSRLAARLERLCGVALTGRNLNTIRALAEMLDG